MSEWDDVVGSIVETIGDYRQGDLNPPTQNHIENWVEQFDNAVRLPILAELNHVLKRTYFSRKTTKQFLAGLYETQSLVGGNPCNFWSEVEFLDIQKRGASQKEMIALFDKLLHAKCGININQIDQDKATYVYLDDALFTGNRVLKDLREWIKNDAPANGVVHIIVIALHRGGYYYADSNIRAAAVAEGKNIEFNWWNAIALEDRRFETATSDVLRPVAIPDDVAVKSYVDRMTYKPHLRSTGSVGALGIFSTDDNRQLLESEFLKAGAKIREMCPHLHDYQRPLGNMVLDTLGFGSLIVTFRNCPNNVPLALWAGDPWYPLFPRVTNSDTSYRKFLNLLAEDEFE